MTLWILKYKASKTTVLPLFTFTGGCRKESAIAISQIQVHALHGVPHPTTTTTTKSS